MRSQRACALTSRRQLTLGIRDEIKVQREKAKVAKTKARGKAAASAGPKQGKASKG